MNYILTPAELEDTKTGHEKVGFQRAEQLLVGVLGGDRDLHVGIGGGKKVSIYDKTQENNVWRRLIDVLDAGKVTNPLENVTMDSAATAKTEDAPTPQQ